MSRLQSARLVLLVLLLLLAVSLPATLGCACGGVRAAPSSPEGIAAWMGSALRCTPPPMPTRSPGGTATPGVTSPTATGAGAGVTPAVTPSLTVP